MRRTCVQIAAAVLTAMGLGLSPAYSQSAPSADCCTDAAQKALAATLGFVDVLGIKLGMSPQQAVAAVRASNPKLKIDVLNTYMTRPSAPTPATKVPHLLVAHTVGVPKFSGWLPPFNLADGSSDEIVLEFTTPPNAPLVGKITREIIFPTGQPVLASTLLDSLRKKYGQENFSNGITRVWIYDASGKLLTRALSHDEMACLPENTAEGFPDGHVPTADDVSKDRGGTLTLASTTMNETAASLSILPERRAVCRPLTIVENYGLGSDVAPNQKMTKLDLTVQSPALLWDSQNSTHDWLQADADAVKKKADDAAKQQTGPKL
jgi:hypothetical protein